MLVNLHVKNLAIIDEVEVDFSEQMNVLTGETGAGKSIIIGSINIALGQKIPKDMIRKGADYALVELVFRVEQKKQQEQIEKLGVSLEDGELVISRKIMANRSVNRINGESVTLAMIRKVADILIDIHGQNEQQSLLHTSKHREILDRYAKEELGDCLEEMSDLFGEYQKLCAEEEEKEIPEEERLREISFMEYELQEIEQANLKAGEEEILEEQYRTLSNASEIAEGLSDTYRMTAQGNLTASDQIGQSLRILHKLSDYSSEVAVFYQQLSEIDTLLTDFNRDISAYMQDFENDPEEFVRIENRLNFIRTIKSKYGATTSLVESYAEKQKEKLNQYREYEKYRAELQKRKKELQRKMEKISEKITKVRTEAGKRLEKEIVQALKDLNFLQVQFQIAVTPADRFSRTGRDEVSFMLSTNPGMDLKLLGEAASGGELSRVMLAVKAVLAQHDEIPTLIFDEIDVGISGRTAQMVAEKMSYIGNLHQVICISHLAQIAAMADAHYLIEKNSEEAKTSTQIRPLSSEESVEELARILGGAQITDAVRESATEMKKLAEKVRTSLRKS